MKITFGASTLADDTASPKVAALIEQWGGSSIVQTEPLYGAVNQVNFPRGNVRGPVVFTAGCSSADIPTAVSAFKTAYGLLNTQDTLTVLKGATTLATMANAVLRDVTRVEWQGLWLRIRYTFEITTIT